MKITTVFWLQSFVSFFNLFGLLFDYRWDKGKKAI